MKTKVLFILSAIFILALMEGVALRVYKSSGESSSIPKPKNEEIAVVQKIDPQPKQEESKPEESSYSTSGNVDSENFPPPSTEVKNGKTERTIHIGVRQWSWDPKTITAKQGELVRLIVHNADVKHGLVIPDLGVNQDIPPEGAVVEFTANKIGTFEFFCSIYCGEGHMEMRGKIVVE